MHQGAFAHIDHFTIDLNSTTDGAVGMAMVAGAVAVGAVVLAKFLSRK
jgi:hypothetical protein